MNGSTQSAAVLVLIFPFTRSVFSQTGMNHVLRVAPEILTPEVVLCMSVCFPDIYIASQIQSLCAQKRAARPSVNFLPHSSLSRVCVYLFALLTLELIQTRHLKRTIFLFSKCGLCCKSIWSFFLPVVLFLASVRPTGARQGDNRAYFPCGQPLLWHAFVCLHVLSLFLFTGPCVSTLKYLCCSRKPPCLRACALKGLCASVRVVNSRQFG